MKRRWHGPPAWEDEVERMLRPIASIGVPCPAYGGRSIANIAPTVVRAVVGETEEGPVPMAPPLLPPIDPFRGERSEGTIVVFLVDGFGWAPFRSWVEAGTSPVAASWASLSCPITTVFPSTTTAAMASLSSGTAPGRHGLVGYRQFLPRYGVVADMLKMSPLGVPTPDLLIGPNWRPSDVVGAPTIFRRGVPAIALSRDKFAGSGFTRLLYDGAEYVPYATAADLAHELERLLTKDAPPKLIYTYWDELDTIQHLRGPSPSLTGFELDRIAHLLDHVRLRLPAARQRSTTVLITGDHGQVPASLGARIAVESVPAIVRELAHPPAGDRRAGFFAARPGRTSALKAALNAALPAGSNVVEMRDAVRNGLFGPPPFHPELEQRLGDLLVLVPSPGALTYLVPGAAPPTRYLIGAHGGLEPDELLVPLVAGPLANFSPEMLGSASPPKP